MALSSIEGNRLFTLSPSILPVVSDEGEEYSNMTIPGYGESFTVERTFRCRSVFTFDLLGYEVICSVVLAGKQPHDIQHLSKYEDFVYDGNGAAELYTDRRSFIFKAIHNIHHNGYWAIPKELFDRVYEFVNFEDLDIPGGVTYNDLAEGYKIFGFDMNHAQHQGRRPAAVSEVEELITEALTEFRHVVDCTIKEHGL